VARPKLHYTLLRGHDEGRGSQTLEAYH
jgi:hypothetical protein